ncbi:polysaccharide biosynthesis C-terminal domain-containing protein [Variovorax sp. dw_954]|uniref:oligosaccharide flippase family protein n=1 Tax=Variovorax sp. dw_954 TaxID=2720078 RepID=UPI001BD5999D
MKRGKFLVALGSAMGSRLATAALNYGLFWALSRMLGTEALGGFSLLMNVFLMVQLLPLLGLTVPLMRRVATTPGSLPVEITNAFAFAAPVSVLLAAIVATWGHVSYSGDIALSFGLVALSLLPTAWTIVAEAGLLAQERVADVARLYFIEALLRTVLAIACVWLGHGLVGVFTVFLVLRFLAALLYALHSMMPFPRLGAWTWQLQKRNWSEVPVFFSIAVVAALVSRLDVLTLSHLRGLHDVATYSAGSRLYDAAQMLPTVTALVVLPTLSRQFLSAREQFRTTLGLSVRIGLLLGLAFAMMAAAFAQPVIDLLYRPDMAAAAAGLRWLIFAAAIMMVDVILSSTMLAASAQRHDLRSLTLGLVALVLALGALVPGFGPTGAAASVVIGLCVRVMWRLRWAVRELGMPPPWLHIARLMAGCAAGVAAMSLALPHGALAAAVAAPAAYAATVVLLGTLGRHPWRTLRADVALLTNRTPS